MESTSVSAPAGAPAPIIWSGTVSSAGSALPAENIVLSEELERTRATCGNGASITSTYAVLPKISKLYA